MDGVIPDFSAELHEALQAIVTPKALNFNEKSTAELIIVDNIGNERQSFEKSTIRIKQH